MKFCRPINCEGQTPKITNAYKPLTHRGVDYGYPKGTPVYASQDGIVLIATNKYDKSWRNLWGRLTTADYGNLIKIRHNFGFATLYAHLKKDSLLVKVGDSVKQGQKIAEVNSTGNSSGNHLHWELRLNEKSINPAPYVDYQFTKYK